jgi:hypothetical protein
MKDYIPFSVISFILVMAMAGLFFLYPADSPKPRPIGEINITNEQDK